MRTGYNHTRTCGNSQRHVNVCRNVIRNLSAVPNHWNCKHLHMPKDMVLPGQMPDRYLVNFIQCNRILTSHLRDGNCNVTIVCIGEMTIIFQDSFKYVFLCAWVKLSNYLRIYLSLLLCFWCHARHRQWGWGLLGIACIKVILIWLFYQNCDQR